MVAFNQTYLAIFDIVESGSTFEVRLQSALEELEKRQESQRKTSEEIEAGQGKLRERARPNQG